MRIFSQLNGFDLIDKLLIISSYEGKLSIDEKTFLPISSEEAITAQAVCAMMRAYGIEPKKEDYEGLDAYDDYMYCFIKDGFSVKRHDKATKLLCRYIGIDREISNMINYSLSCRQSRYRLFRYFFQYLKKLIEVDYAFVEWYSNYSDGFLLSKVITEYAYGKRIEPLVNYYKRILVLLMGDYADRALDKDLLIRDYGYPGIVKKTAISYADLPF
jgi:hypothetical protein